MSYDIAQGDILEWASVYDGELFHALLCDPPYHLTEIVKRFGSPEAAPAQYGTDGAFQRTSKGFMGKVWDGGDVAFRPETWAAVGRLLCPGAFGMAFAGSRGWHRMACAIEDAGLIIHPTIFGWNYLSGFPKATRIDTQIDRRAGAERPIVGRRKHAPKFDAAGHGYREKDNCYNSKDRESFEETAPATELAAAWQGHRYGLQALKPAVEPIIVFQRPYEGRSVAHGRAQGWPLTNSTDGGDGVPNLSGESKARMLATWKGRKHRPESLVRIGAASRGRVKPEAAKQVMREKMRGRVITWGDKISRAVRKLTPDQVREIRARIRVGERHRDIAPLYGVDQGTISNIRRGLSYADVPDLEQAA